MIAVDTNLLLYALHPGSRFRTPAFNFLRDIFKEGAERVGITDYVLVELYNHLRNVAIMRKPLSPKEATEVVQSFWRFKNVTRIESAPIMDRVWDYAVETNFPRRRILDVRLALTLQHHGVTRFATANVKDFNGLGFEKVWNPLSESPRRR